MILRFLFFFSFLSFSFSELFSQNNLSLYPLSFNAFSYSILELSNISLEDEMDKIRLLMVLGSSFNTCGRWLESYIKTYT